MPSVVTGFLAIFSFQVELGGCPRAGINIHWGRGAARIQTFRWSLLPLTLCPCACPAIYLCTLPFVSCLVLHHSRSLPHGTDQLCAAWCCWRKDMWEGLWAEEHLGRWPGGKRGVSREERAPGHSLFSAHQNLELALAAHWLNLPLCYPFKTSSFGLEAWHRFCCIYL